MKVDTSNWSEEICVVKKVKYVVLWTYVVSDFTCEEIPIIFYAKQRQNISYIEFRVENVIKRKGNRLQVKWEGYGNLFNSWISMKDIL